MQTQCITLSEPLGKGYKLGLKGETKGNDPMHVAAAYFEDMDRYMSGFRHFSVRNRAKT